ncbi:MAG: sigma-70 family RNA polymerase sigma factor [Acidobacteriota bacterium]|nr:sigma-70 family RNA polymerase sigma factor [Acidobacteriota bacterium]
MELPAAEWEPPLDELIQNIIARDESALDAFYARTCNRVFGIALKILTRQEPAEEATLEVYAKVWQRAASFQAEKGKVIIWLNTLARNTALDIRRREHRGIAVQTDDGQWIETTSVPPEQEMNTYHGERRRRIQHLLSELSQEQRRVIEAAYFKGLTHSEIAEALDMPLGSVKTRIRSALVTLRRGLQDFQGSIL